MRHQIVPCPSCQDIFVSAPGTCPDCGADVPAPTPEPRPRIVSYRLNRLAAAGGVAVGGLMSGSISILLGRSAGSEGS